MDKKGFTLIELLAVILILAIISLIAVPIIGSIMEDAKRNSFDISVKHITSTIEENCQIERINNKQITKLYTFNDNTITPILNIKGELPKSGSITVNDNCDTKINVNNGNITIIKEYEQTEFTILNSVVYANGDIVYFNPETGNVCGDYKEENSQSYNKTGCMKWYIFNDIDGAEEINMILDHNTSSSQWISSEDFVEAGGSGQGNSSYGPITLNNALISDTVTWKSNLNTRIITAQELAIITKHDKWVQGTYSGYYFDSPGNTPSDSCTLGNITGCNYGWLYDRLGTNCASVGCPNNSDISEVWYWTNTPNTSVSTKGWRVSSIGISVTYTELSNKFGVRPVIEIQKSLLK